MPKKSSEYSPILLEHYRHPRNTGIIKKPQAQAKKINPLCGDEISVYLKIENSKIKDFQYEARGCAITIAAASLLSEKLKNQDKKLADKLKISDIEKWMEIKIPSARQTCATLALEAAIQALNNYRLSLPAHRS